jgi:hypothetical protein
MQVFDWFFSLNVFSFCLVIIVFEGFIYRKFIIIELIDLVVLLGFIIDFLDR